MLEADYAIGQNGYDAANESSSRSLLLFPCNSRAEINRWTRRKLQQKNRALEGSFPFVTRLRSKFGRCVAGKGIFPTPATRDTEWNGLAQALFEPWASNPNLYSIDGSRDLWEDQKLAAEELGAGDGEYFTTLVNVDVGGGLVLPMTQPLDPFEIDSPGLPFAYGSDASPRYEDGVRFDRFLRPIAYSVRELPAPGEYLQDDVGYREVPASAMIHLFRRRRAKQPRGLPPLYSGINDAHAALDRSALEQAAGRLHSLLAVATVRKEANKGKGLGGQIEKFLDDDGNVTSRLEKFPKGAATVELAEGETLQLLNSSRPGADFIEGQKLYCHMVSMGADLPLSVVYSFVGLGGTATRGDLEDAQGTFEMGQDRVVWRHSHPIYVWRLAIAQQRGEIRRCRDPYWWASDWQGPAKMTVDYGRSAQANIDLMKSGMLSVPRYCDERGWKWQSEQDSQIAWLKRAQERCEAEGVDFSRFMEATPGAQQKITVQSGGDE